MISLVKPVVAGNISSGLRSGFNFLCWVEYYLITMSTSQIRAFRDNSVVLIVSFIVDD